MTWAQYAAARHLLAEEGVGVHLRAAQRSEMATVEATKAAIRRHEGVA
ncbi:MAG: hypothetical protein ABI678_05035 [Kofleriaceae bacterium]